MYVEPGAMRGFKRLLWDRLSYDHRGVGAPIADGVDASRGHRCAMVEVFITTKAGVRVECYHNRSG
ncbi:hypothetical protein NOVOSPHI9U_110002 [Novosphingobium sp. 9U]|nr:hypothetical protein NOVOSPHI9U_110002 [Novosphingobium sp. 9U]